VILPRGSGRNARAEAGLARIVSAVPSGAHRTRPGRGEPLTGVACWSRRTGRRPPRTQPRRSTPRWHTRPGVYDYWLDGKDNFAADREAAEQAIRDFPAIVAGVKEQRAFLARAVRYLAGPAGIRQFLDIGTGLPSANNTHEVAQAAAPDSRVVYVDNDPLVLTYARALLASGPNGTTAYLDAIPSGSWLALVHPASDVVPEVVTMARHLSQRSVIPTTLRTHAEVTRFFDGLELLPPGVVQLHHWSLEGAPEEGKLVPAYCGLARKS